MVVNMEIKLPQALGQWHLYHPDYSSTMKEELSEKARKKILTELNVFSGWMQKMIVELKNKYQFMIELNLISSNKTYSSDLPRMLGNDLTVEYQDEHGSFLFSLDSVFLRNLLGIYFGVDMNKVGGFSFTDMEMVLINNFYHDFINNFFLDSGFLAKGYKINFHNGKLGTLKFIASNQTFCQINFELSFLNKTSSAIKLFYSEYYSDKFIERIKLDKPKKVFLSDNMKKGINTDVIVKLGQAKLTFGEFMNIQRGDVLVLDSKIGEKVEFNLADQISFLSSVGQSEGKYCIKLEEQIVGQSGSFNQKTEINNQKEEAKDEELLMNSFDKVNLEEEKEDINSIKDEDDEVDEFDWEKL